MGRGSGNRRARWRATGLWAGLAAMLLAGAGCDVYKVPSSWLPAPLTVDGDSADWGDLPFFGLTGQDVRVGVCNDATDLHLFVSTGRPGLVAQVLAGEFTLWVSPGGGKDRTRGLRIHELPDPDGPARSLTPDHLVELNGHDLAIVANRAGEPGGLAVAMVLDEGWLTCEVRLPLAWVAPPGGVAGTADGTLGLGLQISPAPAGDTKPAEPPAHDRGGARSADGSPPGRGPVMGGGRHGMGGMGGGGMMGGGQGGFGHGVGGSRREHLSDSAAEPREFWFAIQLASQPTARQNP